MKKFEHWQIAYRKDKKEKFALIPNPKWAWAADPFLVEFRDKVYLFAELFLYKSERNGVIGFCEYQNGFWGDWTVTMDRHWHLSYPNVWVYNEKLYMCPETYQTEEVAIYELEAFPDKWRKVHIFLQNGKYVDSTFMRYEGRNYLYTYRLTKSGIIGELLLYEIFRDGTLSEGVCISSDIGKARPGGKVIYQNGDIVRVSQNSTNGYGNGLVFSRIEKIYPNYEESEILQIYPNDIIGEWKREFFGVHTYNRYKNLEVVDLKFRTYSLREYIARKRVRKVFTNKY